MKIRPTRRRNSSEEGYILVVVIFMMALLALTLSVAAAKMAKEIQRDRELETMERGKQYIRAVKMYYKKFNAYPPNVDALVKPTNNIRFLRKKYLDPITGKDDWKPVYLGQNKAPTAMCFFGQPCAGSTIAATGTNSVTGASSVDSAFMSSGSNTDSSTSGSSSSGNSSTSSSTTSTSASSLFSSGSSSTSASGSTGSSTGTSGSFGGGAIIGFSPGSTKKSMMVYKKKDHYNEWEFVYDPITDQMMQSSGSAPTGAVSASSMSSTTSGTQSTTPTTTSSQ